MDYLDWIERVLHASAEAIRGDHNARLIGVPVWEVAKRLDLGVDPMGPDFHGSDERLAILDALDDLEQLGLAEDSDGFLVKLSDEGRKGATASLRPSWPTLFQQVRLDDEMRKFLAAAVTRSEVRREHFAKMDHTTAMEVFEDLGWPWDISHAIALTQSLEAKSCLHAWPTMGGPVTMRVTYVGVVAGTQEEKSQDQQLLSDLLADWETTTVDFKRELNLDSPTAKLEFAHDVLTLANVQGRQRRALVIGFDPKTRAPTKSLDSKNTQDRLEDVVNDNAIGQRPGVRLRTIPWHGVTVGLIEIVRDAGALPYRAGVKLKEKYGADILIRRGTHSAIADADEIADLEAEAARARERGG